MLVNTSRLKSIISILLIILGILGITVLTFDRFLWEVAATERAYPLIGFVIIDFVLVALVFSKRIGFLPVLIWATIRLILNLGDIATAPAWYVGANAYSSFASYLFNPFDSQAVTFGNPAGIPAVPIDLMVIIYLILIVLSLKGKRHK